MPKAYAVPRVCADCPFRRTGGIRLTQRRVHEIARCALGNPGGTFSCHKTVDYSTDEGKGGLHCAGALIFAEKHNHATQMTRIVERLGMYDAAALLATPEAADVFDTLGEMLVAQGRPRRRRRKAVA